MKNNMMNWNDNTLANIAELSFISDRERFQYATRASERFLHSVASLKAGEMLGWQIANQTDGVHCTVFSGGHADVTEEDYTWIFDTCADVKKTPAVIPVSPFAEGRKIYCLSPETDKIPEVSGRETVTENFQDMLNMLMEAGAIIRFAIGVENTGKYGGVIISLPDKMSLRMRSVMSMVRPRMAVEEWDAEKDNCGILPDTYLFTVMGTFINGMIKRREIEMNTDPDREKHFASENSLFVGSSHEYEFKYNNATPIENLDLSIRAFNCLKRAGINEVGQLRKMSDGQIVQIRNLGKKGAEEILTKLAEVKVKEPEKEEPIETTDYMAMLDGLVGLTAVKEQVKKLAAFGKMKQELVSTGQNGMSMSLNMAFVGNPGTAKTTVARILAGIYNEIGILPRTEIVEVGRADLIAKYEGQTAEKVKNVFERAKGKILFIDEAYSLVESWDGSFGDEAISTIVQEMENNRDDTVVIFAGYPDKMERLFAKNAGLRSRVPFFIRFEDYSTEEMVQIAEVEAEKHGFTISPDGKSRVAEICETTAGKTEAGNGRFCRNIVEKAMLDYAMRVYGTEGANEDHNLQLKAEDFSVSEIKETEKKTVSIGFKP